MLKNKILAWIKKEIAHELLDLDIRVWLFGSIAIDCQTPEDCDVLIIYDKKFMDSIVTKSFKWQIKFAQEFDFPLHLTRLTIEEAEENPLFLAEITTHQCK